MSTSDDFVDIDAALAAADAALRGLGVAQPANDEPALDGLDGLDLDPLADGDGSIEIADFQRPCLRLFCESIWIDHGRPGADDYRETKVAVIGLTFEYAGFSIRASDPRMRVFCGTQGGMTSWMRDLDRETQARYTLESFGAIQIDLLEDYGTTPDSRADYLVHLQSDHHTQCAFTAYAVPQLQALGWKVEIDPAYPYQVVTDEPPWYAVVEEDDGASDWFNLELGVEVGGHRINLLPVLLDMLDDGGAQLDLSMLHSRAPRFVPLPDEDRYLPVPPERFETLMRVMGELYQGDGREGERLQFPAVRAVCLGELDEALGSVEQPFKLQTDERTETRVRALKVPSEPLPEGHGGLRATLRPYQLDGLRWLQHLRAQELSGVLADDMGLGKTLQTIAHLCVEVKSGRAHHPSMIVAPTSLVGNWRRELAKFAPHLSVCVLHGPRRHEQRPRAATADVIITTYPVLMRDGEFFDPLTYHLLVLDEAQTIKNPRSRSHQAVKQLDARHRLCLSGTPIENNLDELWSLFDFLMPNFLGSEMQFRHFFRQPIEQQHDEMRLLALRQQVSPFILRRMKDQVARDLPKKTEVVRPVALEGKQRELYESIRVAAHAQVRSAIKKKGVAASTLTILDALMKLRQLCNDPRLVRGHAARFVRESAKYELLFEMLGQQLPDGRRVLIFSQFTSMLSLIGQGLDERGIGHVSLTGSTPDRDRPVRAFENGDVDVFLISLKAGGTGLNLVSADTVIHYDPWWNPAAQDQATDRAYRIGQTRPVFVYNLIAAGSVEERMLGLQQRKRRLAQGVIGTGMDRSGTTLDENEVEHLLSPLE